MRQNFNAEPIAISEHGTSQQWTYLAYLWSFMPSSSTHVAKRTEAGSSYYGHQNPLSGPSGGQSLHRAHPIDFYDHPWAPMPSSYSPHNSNTGVVEQLGIPMRAMRMGGVHIGTQQRGSLHSFYGNRFERLGIPCATHMAPQLVRAFGNINEQGSSSLFTRSQGSGLMRQPLGVVGSVILPQHSAFSGSSSMENSKGLGGNSIYYILERAPFGPHSSMNNERVWTPS